MKNLTERTRSRGETFLGAHADLACSVSATESLVEAEHARMRALPGSSEELLMSLVRRPESDEHPHERTLI